MTDLTKTPGICDASGFKVPLGILDVRPPFACNNQVDKRLADPELCGKRAKLAAFCVSRTNFGNRLIIKFAGIMGRTFGRVSNHFSAPLRIHVASVVERRTGKQVVRLAADRIVAFVTNKKPFSVPARQGERKAMNVMANTVERKRPISALFAIAGPLPTTGFWLINSAPQRARDGAVPLHYPTIFERFLANRAKATNHVPS